MRFNPTSLISLALRSIPTFLPPNPSPSSSIQKNSIFTLIMNPSSSSKEGSRRLINIAQQLRLYKAPPNSFDDNSDNEEIEEENDGKVVSQVGFAESSTPITVQQQKPERFKPKKAAVLICLFEDDLGVLRVVLTKRSSKLSTHSGEVSLPGGKAEEGDASDAETALREAEEEIGLQPSIVNVVTVLEPFLSKQYQQYQHDDHFRLHRPHIHSSQFNNGGENQTNEIDDDHNNQVFRVPIHGGSSSANDLWISRLSKLFHGCSNASHKFPKAEFNTHPNRYLMIATSGGLNQQRTGITDAVVAARILNATLIVPKLDQKSFWKDSSNFSEIFDVDWFISSLSKDVKILKELPLRKGKVVSPYRTRVPRKCTPACYQKRVLPLLQKKQCVYLELCS